MSMPSLELYLANVWHPSAEAIMLQETYYMHLFVMLQT